MSGFKRLLLFLGSTALVGCASATALQTARVLPVGESQVGAAVEAFRGPAPFKSDPAPVGWAPQVELVGRRGVSERVDCGGKIWFPFVRGDCKFELLRSRWVDLAIAGGAAGHYGLSAILVDGYVPLYLDLNLYRQPYEPGAITLVVSATPIGRCYLAEGRDPRGCWLQVGASAGVVAQVSKNVALMVEAARYQTLIEPGEAMGSGLLHGYQFAAGFLLRIPSSESSRPGPGS